MGSCDLFEEKQVGNERFNIFSGCPSGRTATIVLRGGADQVCSNSILLPWIIWTPALTLSFGDFSLLKRLSGVYTMQL